MKWKVLSAGVPENVNVELVLDSDDEAVIVQVERAANVSGVRLERIDAEVSGG